MYFYWISIYLLKLLVVAITAATYVVATTGYIGYNLNSPESIQLTQKVQAQINEPLKIKAGSSTFTVSPVTIRLRYFANERFFTFDYAKLEAQLSLIAKKVDTPAVDAALDIDTMDVIPHKEGREVDLPKTLAMVAEKLYRGKLEGPFEAAVRTVQPSITTAEIEAYDPEPLGKFTTNFNRWQTNRVSNIRLAVASMNNYMLKPGEVFSFNQIVGERTPERGYKEAGIIKEGKFDTGIGGGICQVSSTLFNAACWQAHLPVVERHRHNVSVKYVRPGHDATVNWGSYDFKFQNPYEDKTLVIKAKVEGSSVTIAIYAPKGTVKGEPLPQFKKWASEPIIHERKDEPEKKPEEQVLPEDGNPTLDPVPDTNGSNPDKNKDKAKKSDKAKDDKEKAKPKDQAKPKDNDKPKDNGAKPDKSADKPPKDDKPKDDGGSDGDSEKEEIPTQPPELGW